MHTLTVLYIAIAIYSTVKVCMGLAIAITLLITYSVASYCALGNPLKKFLLCSNLCSK